MARYRNFFGIQSDAQLKKESDGLKRNGDFTSPDNFEVCYPSFPNGVKLQHSHRRKIPPYLLLSITTNRATAVKVYSIHASISCCTIIISIYLRVLCDTRSKSHRLRSRAAQQMLSLPLTPTRQPSAPHSRYHLYPPVCHLWFHFHADSNHEF